MLEVWIRWRWDGWHPLLLECLGQLRHMCRDSGSRHLHSPTCPRRPERTHDTLLKSCTHSPSSFWLPLVLCFNTTTPDLMQPATLRSLLPESATMSKLVPGFLSCLQPSRTSLERVGQTCLKESERTCTSAWAAVPSTSGGVTVPKQVIRNLIQSMPTRCPPVTDSRRSKTPNDLRATQLQNTD